MASGENEFDTAFYNILKVPYNLLGAPRQKKGGGPNKRTDQSSRKNTSDEDITNLLDAQFQTLVIRMLTELVEYDHKIEEKVKAMTNEIKENVQGTNSDGKETGTQINGWNQKEEKNIQPEQNEETRIFKK